MVFPSILCSCAKDNCSILDCLPNSLLNENPKQFCFISIKKHIRTRFTTLTSATSTDPRYCAFSYDMIMNLTSNHKYSRVILDRGLTVGNDNTGRLGLRGKRYSTLLESADNNTMV